ncbi:MAG: glycosyltransferase [Acidimicrobiales bacterium]
MTSVLIVTEDAIGERMAGPAIRAWNMAGCLAGSHEVVLATTRSPCDKRSDRFRVEAAGADRLADLEGWCEVLVVQGYVLERHPVLNHSTKATVVDLYDPLHFETLELTRHDLEPDRSANVAHSVQVLTHQLGRGDFFLCASDKQRDLWLGHLGALGRLNPDTYRDDPSLRRLIEVAPFGVPEEPPVKSRAVLRGVVAGIAPDDEVVLWGGGIYDWLDPLTAVRAVDVLRHRRPNLRLVLLGARHPNPAVEESGQATAARRESAALSLTGSHVFFHDDWVPYADRHEYLLEADIGISLHVEHLESAYSFRTRVLDYLWAGLPIVATAGDGFAEVIAGEDLGAVVAGGDPAAVAGALQRLLGDTQVRAACGIRAAAVARRYAWPVALAPLVAFCAEPRRAADSPRWDDQAEPTPAEPMPAEPGVSAEGWRQDLRIVKALYHEGGIGAVAGGVRSRWRRRHPHRSW